MLGWGTEISIGYCMQPCPSSGVVMGLLFAMCPLIISNMHMMNWCIMYTNCCLLAVSSSCPTSPLSLALVVRHIYLRPGVGVGALQKVYGGKQVVESLCGVHQFSWKF